MERIFDAGAHVPPGVARTRSRNRSTFRLGIGGEGAGLEPGERLLALDLERVVLDAHDRAALREPPRGAAPRRPRAILALVEDDAVGKHRGVCVAPGSRFVFRKWLKELRSEIGGGVSVIFRYEVPRLPPSSSRPDTQRPRARSVVPSSSRRT
jgi:hypothetical protein